MPATPTEDKFLKAERTRARLEVVDLCLAALRALREYEDHVVFCESCNGRFFQERNCVEGTRLQTETNRQRHNALARATECGL